MATEQDATNYQQILAMIERNTPLEKIVDYALQLVIEGGMRPTPASRMAAKRYGYSRHHICHKLTHHPRYIEHQGGKPAGYGVIPASIIDDIIVMLERTPELGLMGCIRKYKEESGCTFHEQAIAGKYRRLTKANALKEERRNVSSTDTSDCLLDLSPDELVRRGYLIRVTEQTTL